MPIPINIYWKRQLAIVYSVPDETQILHETTSRTFESTSLRAKIREALIVDKGGIE